MHYKAVSIDPETLGGTPVFKDTRVTVRTLFDYIEGGESLEEFLDDFPSVLRKHALEVLEMAKTTLTSEKVLNENFAR